MDAKLSKMAGGKLREVTAPLIGSPAWQVKKGYGSFLTFEFGSPSLRVTEPNEHRRRRSVSVHGEWHLWIYSCNWQIKNGDASLAHSESPDGLIEEAASFLDGQRLDGVEVRPDGSTIFRFDRGGLLATSPYEGGEADEQWMLFEPSGMVFSVYPGGKYSHVLGSAPPDEEELEPLFP